MAGSAVIIAGPAVAAAGIGYGAYRIMRRVRLSGTARAISANNNGDAHLDVDGPVAT